MLPLTAWLRPFYATVRAHNAAFSHLSPHHQFELLSKAVEQEQPLLSPFVLIHRVLPKEHERTAFARHFGGARPDAVSTAFRAGSPPVGAISASLPLAPLMCGLDQTLDIESVRASDAARRRCALVVEARRTREDPQVLAVRRRRQPPTNSPAQGR